MSGSVETAAEIVRQGRARDVPAEEVARAIILATLADLGASDAALLAIADVGMVVEAGGGLWCTAVGDAAAMEALEAAIDAFAAAHDLRMPRAGAQGVLEGPSGAGEGFPALET